MNEIIMCLYHRKITEVLALRHKNELHYTKDCYERVVYKYFPVLYDLCHIRRFKIKNSDLCIISSTRQASLVIQGKVAIHCKLTIHAFFIQNFPNTLTIKIFKYG